MRKNWLAALAAVAIACGGTPLRAQEAAKAGEPEMSRLPADASTKQTTRAGGRSLSFTATAGSLPVRNDKGKLIAEVGYTAYMLDGPRSPDRPVTFAFNGGPGAPSVYLEMGLIGPKKVQFGAQGDTPSSATRVTDNDDTWLDFTDLVFIDPVGTGFSKSYVSDEESKKAFYGPDQDSFYLSRIIYDWLVKNGRLSSPKYLVGESYGGFRLPRIAYTLQSDMGVGVWGMTLVSPRLDYGAMSARDLSPMFWAMGLPSMAATKREADGKILTLADMADVEEYARTEYIVDLLRGARNPATLDRMSKKVADHIGLDPVLVRQLGGRVDIETYSREFQRARGLIGSRYDVNVTAHDPFPWSPRSRAGDPILEGIMAPTTSAKVDYVTRTIGWKPGGRYDGLNETVFRLWEHDGEAESTTALRQTLAIDPKMKVLIVHGFTDIQTPYFSSRLIIDQIPSMSSPDQIRLAVYPGGHMFYSRPDSRRMMRNDVLSIYRRN